MLRTNAYRAGVLAAVAVSVALFLCLLHQASLRGQDVRAQGTFTDIGDKLYSYTYAKQTVPDTLKAAGVNKVPSYISYKKLAPNKYRLCVTYKSAYVPSYQGHEGLNCQDNKVYVKPFVKNKDGTYNVCGVKSTRFTTEADLISPPAAYPSALDVGGELFFFTSGSKAFDESCNPIKQSDLHVGDKVDVFNAVPSSGPPAVSTFLKRS